MASPLDRLHHSIHRLRNSEHTGERRCWPCTAANTGILLLACAAVARRRSRSLAAALGVGGAVTIALRGYLVPYTPRFAPGLTSWLPGEVFHGDERTPGPGATDAPEASGSLGGASGSLGDSSGSPEDSSGSLGSDSGAESGEAVLAALLDRGVVVADEETVFLEDDFRETWRAEMRDLRNWDDEDLANALRAAAPVETVVDVVEQGDSWWRDGETWFVISDGSDDPARENWLTRTVAVAEAAAVRALGDETALDATRRAQAAGPLRTFLEACPVCDGPVEETTTVECCGGPGGTRADAPDEVLVCTDCDERLYTFR